MSAQPSLFDEAPKVKLRVYCGAYFGPPQPPDGEPGECGWTCTAEQLADEWNEGIPPMLTCGRCGSALGLDDMELVEDRPRAARVEFLAGMLGGWSIDGKPTDAQRRELDRIAQDALDQAGHLTGPSPS